MLDENLEMWKRTYDLDFVMWDEVGMIIHEMMRTGYTISEIQEALVDRIVVACMRDFKTLVEEDRSRHNPYRYRSSHLD
jgi:hypothetical protein